MDEFVTIVDDDPLVCTTIGMMLDQLGIAHVAYTSGGAFIDTVDRRRGAVLLDLRMPGMDGLQVMQHLRDMGSDLPVVLVSGRADIRSAVGAMKLGAVDVLLKPFSSEDLRLVLDRCFALLGGQGAAEDDAATATRKVAMLSPRQRQVLQGIVAGMTNKAMARRFRLSPRTIEMHRATAFSRLGATGIAAAIRLAGAAQLPRLADDL